MMKFFYVGIVFGLIVPYLTLAQGTNDFLVRALVGSDTTPPATPTISALVPMSPYQIDVTWGAVTDDTLVGGYRVYRDGILLATTTLTSYSDTGLTPSTTYSYTVDAFDFVYNISPLSGSQSTTTLALPSPIATSTASTTSSLAPSATAVPTLRTFTVDARAHEAYVSFTSYGPTRYTLRFGRTTEYELGTISSNIFGYNHQSRLSSLEPGTTYYIELTLINAQGITRIVTTESFITEAPIKTTLPQSVTNVRALIIEDDVVLSWRFPAGTEGVVRVVRNHFFYPSHPLDGVVVYEGAETRTIDTDVFEKQSQYYYSIFVIDAEGQVSAPAVIMVAASRDQSGQKNNNGQPLATTSSVKPIPILPIEDTGPIGYLVPSDVFITYEGVTRTLDSLVPITVHGEMLISVPFAAVPRHLKTILVSLSNPQDHRDVTTYLLKLNSQGTAYEVTVASSGVVGEGHIIIEVFDYEHQSVRRLTRLVQYVDGHFTATDMIEALIVPSPLWLIVPLVGFFWLWWWYRRREDNR
jgi:chitodextrinase